LDLPIVSGKFVTVYQQMKESRLLEVHGKSLQSRERGRIEEEQIRKGLFLLLEPEVYQVFQEELMAPGCSFYDTTIFSGLVASYFLFRQGFSDENFWEDDFVEDLDPTDSQVSQE